MRHNGFHYMLYISKVPEWYITFKHLSRYELKSSGHGEDLVVMGISGHFVLLITSASFMATLYICRQLILPWNLFSSFTKVIPPILIFVLFANVSSQLPSSKEKYSTWFKQIWKSSEIGNMISAFLNLSFFIIDYTNITNRLFLRRAIFIKISEAIVDVKCPEIFDAVICECNELPCIGLEFT